MFAGLTKPRPKVPLIAYKAMIWRKEQMFFSLGIGCLLPRKRICPSQHSIPSPLTVVVILDLY